MIQREGTNSLNNKNQTMLLLEKLKQDRQIMGQIPRNRF